MATKKFIKLYSILKDDIDSKGNINPNAALYPLFAEQYRDNTTGKRYADLPPEQIKEHLSDENTSYDNRSNAHPNRTVVITERNEDPFENGSTMGRVGPNLKRGFSVMAYSNKNKRSGKDYFNVWEQDDPSTSDHSINYFSDFEHSPTYASYATPQNDINTLGGILNDFTNARLHSKFYRVPLIVTAEDSDIIDINDVLKDNYDPLRDFPSEQQLKRIIKRSIVPNGQFNTQELDNELIALLKDIVNKRKVSAINVLNTLPKLQKSNTQNIFNLLDVLDEVYSACENFLSAAYMLDYSSQKQLAQKAFYMLVEKGIIPNISSATSSAVDYTNSIQHTIKNIKRIYEYKAGNIYIQVQDIHQTMSKLELVLKEAIDVYTEVIKALDELQHSNISIPIGLEYDFSKILGKGGAFDWYDEATSSDERIKDIVDTGKQVTLSDKQQKYILDDFNNFCDSYQKHNRLLKGIKEVGQ